MYVRLGEGERGLGIKEIGKCGNQINTLTGLDSNF